MPSVIGSHATEVVSGYLDGDSVARRNPAGTSIFPRSTLADVVLWLPRSFGIKPNMVIKGGMPAWGAFGDGDATVAGAEPRVYGPPFGGRGQSAAVLSITFVSQASLDAGLQKRLNGYHQLQPVQNTRTVGKKNMLFNHATPPVRVHPVTHDVTIDGKKIGIEPLNSVPLSRLYIVS